jgi:hypothetical protein
MKLQALTDVLTVCTLIKILKQNLKNYEMNICLDKYLFQYSLFLPCLQ